MSRNSIAEQVPFHSATPTEASSRDRRRVGDVLECRSPHSRGHRVRAADARLGEDDDELVAAEATDRVVAARRAPDRIADRGQHPVALDVPRLVVDALEAVEVEEAAGKPVARFAGSAPARPSRPRSGRRS